MTLLGHNHCYQVIPFLDDHLRDPGDGGFCPRDQKCPPSPFSFRDLPQSLLFPPPPSSSRDFSGSSSFSPTQLTHSARSPSWFAIAVGLGGRYVHIPVQIIYQQCYSYLVVYSWVCCSRVKVSSPPLPRASWHISRRFFYGIH